MNSFIHVPDISNTVQIRNFHIRTAEPGWKYGTHFHQSFELMHCLDGSADQGLNRDTIVLQKGDWVLIPSGMRHKTTNGSPAPFTYLSLMFDIDDPDFRHDLKQLSRIAITSGEALGTELGALVQELNAIVYQFNSSSDNESATIQLSLTDRLNIQGYILQIIKNVILILKQDPHRSNDKSKVNAYEVDVACQIERIILTSLCTPELTVKQIANQLGVSRIQCTKLFSAVYGVSPRQYITSQRLLLAKEKLINTNQSIESIALEIGFSSLSHFSRQFKRWIGVSPLNYRPRHFI